MDKMAILGSNGKYRYKLSRRWGEGRAMLFCMLNPSTADADVDDQTIRKCIGFAKKYKRNAITVINLYAIRTTYPSMIATFPDPVGPDNLTHQVEEIKAHDGIVLAWGAVASTYADPRIINNFIDLLRVHGKDALCLGYSKDGSPRHPCMLPYSAELQRFDPFHNEEL